MIHLTNAGTGRKGNRPSFIIKRNMSCSFKGGAYSRQYYIMDYIMDRGVKKEIGNLFALLLLSCV